MTDDQYHPRKDWPDRPGRGTYIVAALVLLALAALVLADRADAHFIAGCQKAPCKQHVVRPFAAKLNAIKGCETKGLGARGWTYDGLHDGGFQFHPTTWRATGSPYAYAFQAPPLEQRYRAVVWAARIGFAWSSTAGWPVCGR